MDTNIQLAKEFIEKGRALIKDKNVITSYQTATNALELSEKEIDGNEEKLAWFNFMLSNVADKLAHYLYRNALNTPELDELIRKVELPEVAVERAREFAKPDQEKAAELNKLNEEIRLRRKEIEIFQGMLSGKSKKEAQQEYAEFMKRSAQAMGQLVPAQAEESKAE